MCSERRQSRAQSRAIDTTQLPGLAALKINMRPRARGYRRRTDQNKRYAKFECWEVHEISEKKQVRWWRWQWLAKAGTGAILDHEDAENSGGGPIERLMDGDDDDDDDDDDDCLLLHLRSDPIRSDPIRSHTYAL